MGHRIHFAVIVVALVLVASASAAAAPARISGSVNKRGYTLIALSSSGKAVSVLVKGHTFRLRPPATRVTLHLRSPNGVYAGPVVVGTKSKRKVAILGVKAGARLGTIKVRRGYASLAKRLSTRWVDTRRYARAKKGVPTGAGVFGRVRSRNVRATVPGDSDLDGIPDIFDIDDDGDRILDAFDSSNVVRAAQNGEPGFQLQTSLSVNLDDTANADAPGLTPAQLDAAMVNLGRLDIEVLPGGELDCGRPQQRTDPTLGGLVYCTKGGTGTLNRYVDPPPRKFPECCDADGDGFGTPLPTGGDSPQGTPFMFLFPGATSAQIGTGDLLIQRVTKAGVERDYAAMLGYAFATVPALKSFSDGSGSPVTVSYPVAGNDPGPSGPGTQENPFVVTAGSGGDVVLRLTFWRPQRRPIPGEAGYSDPPTAWTDMGRLVYIASLSDQPSACGSSSLSEHDPNLAPGTVNGSDGFADTAPDRPADPANTFTYTLNVTTCLSSHGLSFKPGDTTGFNFAGLTAVSGDDAGQNIYFKRQ